MTDKESSPSATDHDVFCNRVISKVNRSTDIYTYLDTRTAIESTTNSNLMAMVVLLSDMATVGLSPYGDQEKSSCRPMFENGALLALDVLDTIAKEEQLDTVHLRRLLLTSTSTRRDLEGFEGTESDVRRALTEMLLRLGESAYENIDPAYEVFIGRLFPKFHIAESSRRHFNAGFGVFMESGILILDEMRQAGNHAAASDEAVADAFDEWLKTLNTEDN